MKLLKVKDPFTVYIYSCFLSAFIFTFVFTVNLLYHVQIVKLDPLQLVLVGTVLELTVFLFEIPTGLVADIKSRKFSIIIGYFLIGVGFLIEGLFPAFVAVLLSQILWGIGYTFTSGAGQAWIADEIGEERASLAFLKGAKAGNFGKIIAIPLSILAGYFMVNLPIIIGGICMLGLSILLIFFMKEDHFKPVTKVERASTWAHLKDNIKNIIDYGKASFLLRILFLIALLFGFYSEGFDRLWMSHFIDEANLSTFTGSKLVLFMGGLELITVLISFGTLHYMGKSSIYEKQKYIYISLFIGSFLIIGSLLGFAFSTSIVSLLIFYIVIQMSRQSMNPLMDIWLNKLIVDSRTRATFFSVKGQIDAIGQIGGGPVIGFIATNFMIKTAFVICAILLAPVLFLYYLVMKKDRE
ncbi:MFS transporter [Bacillus sp. CGMCC 1.16607]|uniref:MFS transporter n=1 Tax=Bacillus sp. CGMCC 1.16607 TaxID=3351842 RepID=UPI00364277F1